MKPYDATKYLKQMFCKPDIVPFAGVLMMIILLFIGLPGPGWGGSTRCYTPHNLPGTLFGGVEPLNGIPVICIYTDGRVCFEDHFLTDLSNFATMIEDNRELRQPVENKVYLEIDKDVEFGRVQEVLRCIKEAEVEDVAIITKDRASMFDFFNPIKGQTD